MGFGVWSFGIRVWGAWSVVRGWGSGLVWPVHFSSTFSKADNLFRGSLEQNLAASSAEGAKDSLVNAGNVRVDEVLEVLQLLLTHQKWTPFNSTF